MWICHYFATIAATHANEVVDDSLRGTGNGIFNSFQYIGNFAGALATGALWGVSQQAAWLGIMAAGIIGFLIIFFNNPSSKKRQEGKGSEHEG